MPEMKEQYKAIEDAMAKLEEVRSLLETAMGSESTGDTDYKGGSENSKMGSLEDKYSKLL